MLIQRIIFLSLRSPSLAARLEIDLWKSEANGEREGQDVTYRSASRYFVRPCTQINKQPEQRSD